MVFSCDLRIISCMSSLVFGENKWYLPTFLILLNSCVPIMFKKCVYGPVVMYCYLAHCCLKTHLTAVVFGEGKSFCQDMPTQ